MSTALLVNLTASALWSGVAGGIATGREWYEDRERREAIAAELDDLPTEFNRALKQTLDETIAEKNVSDAQRKDLRFVLSEWDDEIAPELASLDDCGYFGTEREGIETITETIISASTVKIEDETETTLRALVGEQYKTMIEEFEATVDESGLDAALTREYLDELHGQLDDVAAAIERIEAAAADEYDRPYELYDPATDRETAVREISDTTLVEFVDRPELGAIDTDRTVIVGPAGSGKTRLLCEAVREFDADGIEHLLVPGEELQVAKDAIDAFQREVFDGDVLLVWDDLHAVNPERDNAVVRQVIRKLESMLADTGHDLHVLAATRSENIESLPRGLRDGTRELSDEFSAVWLGELDESSAELLARRLLHEREVGYSDDGVELLAKRAGETRSAPAYLDAVAKSTRGHLRGRDITALPETATEVWKAEYDELRDADSRADEQTWHLLEAFAALYEVGVPAIPSLAKGVFKEVLVPSAGETVFRRRLERLIDWGWCDVPDGVAGEQGTVQRFDFVLDVHDTQLEAVEWEYDQDTAESVSAYLLASVEGDQLPEDFEPHQASGRFATQLPDTFLDVRADHYERMIEQTDAEENPVAVASHRVAYANLLKERGDERVAARHYALALQHQPDDAKAHSNYAVLLRERGDERVAARHYALALQHQPDYAKAHSNYANLLKERGDERVAARHYALALQHQPDDANAHSNYANLLRERGDERVAARHYALALQHQPDFAEAHYNYAVLLEERGDERVAARHYALALQHQPDFAEAHSNYAALLYNRGDRRAAARHFALGVQYAPDDAEIRSNYALFLRRRGDYDVAIRQYRISIAIPFARGRLRTAIANLSLLIETCDEVGRVEPALELIERLCERADEIDGFPQSVRQHLESTKERLSTDPIERARTQYDEGLDAVEQTEANSAIAAFQTAWRLRSYFETPPASALAAGMWLVAFDSLTEATVADDEIRSTVESNHEDLPPVEAELYRTVFTDEQARVPVQLNRELDSTYWNAKACAAYRALLNEIPAPATEV